MRTGWPPSVAVVLAFSACQLTTETDGLTPTSIEISPPSVSVESLGGIVQLSARAFNDVGSEVPVGTISWTSENPSVASVSESGRLRVRQRGETTITATLSSGARGTIPVVVTQVAVTLELAATAVRLTAFDAQATLRPEARDAGGNRIVGHRYDWTSSDPGVAAVDSTGVVTAVSNGAVEVTASADGLVDTIAVVVEQEPSGVVVVPSFVILDAIGDTARLEADVVDYLGHAIQGLSVQWTSTVDAITSVSPDGRVTAEGPGPSGIVATHGAVQGVASLTVGSPDDWSAVGDWTTYQGGETHAGYVPVVLDVERFATVWTATPQYGAHLNAVTSEGGHVAYSTDQLGTSTIVGVLSAETGVERWSVALVNALHAGPPAVRDGTMFVASGWNDASRLWAFDAATGDTLFSTAYDNRGRGYLAPAVSGGKVYMGGGVAGGLYRFDAITGAMDWHTPWGRSDQWTPAVSEGRVLAYVGGPARRRIRIGHRERARTRPGL